MTTFRSSSPTERAFMRDKSWQHPARRQHIHGKVIGLPDRRNPMWWRVGRGIVLVSAMYALKIAVVG